jgi:myo-inositol-1(or 4)-monophosphatase
VAAAFLETASSIAREAGGLLSVFFERRVSFEHKSEHDLVTAADRASEALIVERLRSHYPAHSIVAEEGGGHESPSEYRWFVDPLDGTTNFAHGFPMFNVSIGLERKGEMVAGAVYHPIHDEMFTAELGGGAYLNGKRIHVSQTAALADSLVATGFPNRWRENNFNVHFFHQMAMMTHGVRRPGAAALDLAYVAAGRLDAFWEFGLHSWDMAAGILLVTEAGGTVSDMDGAPLGPLSSVGPHILADNGRVHPEILSLFGEVFRGQYRSPMPAIPERR